MIVLYFACFSGTQIPKPYTVEFMKGKDLLQNGNYWNWTNQLGKEIIISYQMRQPGQWHCFDVNALTNPVVHPITRSLRTLNMSINTGSFRHEVNGKLRCVRKVVVKNPKVSMRSGDCDAIRKFSVLHDSPFKPNLPEAHI